MSFFFFFILLISYLALISSFPVINLEKDLRESFDQKKIADILSQNLLSYYNSKSQNIVPYSSFDDSLEDYKLTSRLNSDDNLNTISSSIHRSLSIFSSSKFNITDSVPPQSKKSVLNKLINEAQINVEDSINTLFSNIGEIHLGDNIYAQNDFNELTMGQKIFRDKIKDYTKTLNKKTLDTEPKLPIDHFCYTIVDYDFYIPENMNSTDLNNLARSYISTFSSYSIFLSDTCRTDILRYFCSIVYREKSENPYLSNGELINYKRPCDSIINDIDSTCSTTVSTLVFALTGQGFTFTTSIPDPYSTLTPKSDAFESDTNQCFSLSSTGVALVSGPKEPYIGTTCIGITETVFIPDANTIDPLLPLWLPPFFLQTNIIESFLVEYLSYFPRVFSKDCMKSLYEINCGSYLMQPYDTTFYSFPVTVPSFPSYDFCNYYQSACIFPISMVPRLNKNCANENSYPKEDYVFIPGLSSPPNNFENSTLSIEVQCPYGYAPTPDHIDGGTIPIPYTSCSVACPIAMYTEGEYDRIYFQTSVMIYVAMICICLQVINICVIKYEKRNVFLICSILASFVYMFMQLIQLVVTEDHDNYVCSNEASWYTKYSYGESTASDLCIVAGYVGTYNTWFSWWIMISLSCEMWVRVAMGVRKNVDYHRRYYMWGTLVLFTVHALVVTLYKDPVVVVPGGFAVFCNVIQRDTDYQYYLQVLPGTIYFCISFFLIAHSLYICISTSLRVSDYNKSPLKKIWKNYSMLFLFLLLSVFIYPVNLFLINTKWSYVDGAYYARHGVNWLNCLFTEYFEVKNHINNNYIKTCGIVPSIRLDPDQMLIPFLIPAYLSCVLIFVITCNKEVKIFWFNLFINFLEITRLGKIFSFILSCFLFKPVKMPSTKQDTSTNITSSQSSSSLNNSLSEENITSSTSVTDTVRRSKKNKNTLWSLFKSFIGIKAARNVKINVVSTSQHESDPRQIASNNSVNSSGSNTASGVKSSGNVTVKVAYASECDLELQNIP